MNLSALKESRSVSALHIQISFIQWGHRCSDFAWLWICFLFKICLAFPVTVSPVFSLFISKRWSWAHSKFFLSSLLSRTAGFSMNFSMFDFLHFSQHPVLLFFNSISLPPTFSLRPVESPFHLEQTPYSYEEKFILKLNVMNHIILTC